MLDYLNSPAGDHKRHIICDKTQFYPETTDHCERNRAKRKALRYRTAEHWQSYYELRDKARNYMETAEQRFFSDLSIKSKTHPKPFWNYINSIRSESSFVPFLVDSQGNKATNDTEKCDMLNQQYCSQFVDLADNQFRNSDNESSPTIRTMPYPEITPQGLRKLMINLQEYRSRWHR